MVLHLDREINMLYNAADFLTRFFMLLGNPSFSANLEQIKAEQEKAQEVIKHQVAAIEKQNKNREKKRKELLPLPIAPIAHIKIDLAKGIQNKLESEVPTIIRQLLGWTDVRRSKEIISKNGIRFTRGPHERRIPSAVDRRGPNAMRDVTISNGPV